MRKKERGNKRIYMYIIRKGEIKRQNNKERKIKSG
jgi:hypothetical protein